MADIEQQARQMLAAEYAQLGYSKRLAECPGACRMSEAAVRVIAAALRATPEPTQLAGWQVWDAASEAWESASEQLYWVVKNARPHEAREVFTTAPVTLDTVKPPRDLRTKLEDR